MHQQIRTRMPASESTDMPADDLTSGQEEDGLTRGAQDDSLTGGAQDDSLTGGAQDDSLTGGAQDDSLAGRERVDRTLAGLLRLLAPRYNLCVAGFSTVEPDTFVFAIDHPDDEEDDTTQRCYELVQRQFQADLVDAAWTELENVPGALLEALERLGATSPRELFIGETEDHRHILHVRKGG